MQRRKQHVIYDRYLADQRTKLFRFCARFDSIGIFILAAAALFDYFVFGCSMSIPLRGVPAVFMLAELAACQVLGRRMLPFLSFGHGAVLVSLVGMELGRVFLSYHLSEFCRIGTAEAVTGLIVLMFIVFLFSYHLRRYVPLLIAGPYGIFLAVLLLFSQMKAEEMVMLIYPTGLLILFVPITSFIEKGFFHEFWLRLLAERRREKLQEELSRIEQLNTKLEETKESLEREIEERKQVENRLEYLAAYDELTGVYNRRAGIELLKHSLEVARRRGNAVTVAFVDVDQLKSVNDNLGHDAGDRYLLEVVSVLRKFLRKSDVVIRYGGDEFVVILDECTEAEAEETFERIEWEMVHRRSEEGLFAVSFSYGFAEAGPGESWTYQQLLTAADKKMYIQKQRKRQG